MECPKCHKDIADTVVECPHCHIVVSRYIKRQAEKAQNPALAKPPPPAEEPAKKGMGTLEWLSLILVIVATWFFYLRATGKYEAKAPVINPPPLAKPTTPQEDLENLPKMEDVAPAGDMEPGPTAAQEGIEKVEKLIDRTAPMLPGDPKAVLEEKE